MRWTRNYPVVIGGSLAVLMCGLVGAAALTRGLPDGSGRNLLSTPFVDTTASAAAAKSGQCRNCGFVSSIRSLEVTGGNVRRIYRITIHMDDGSERAVSQVRSPAFQVGNRVRVQGDAIERG